MRPDILNPLFAPVNTLPGVGPRIAKAIEHCAGPLVVDLLWHLPSGLIDRRFSPTIAAAPAGVIVTLKVRVESHHKPAVRRLPYKVRCSDESGELTLVFFHAREKYLLENLPVGEIRVISGRTERYGDEIQLVHPDHIAPEDEIENILSVEPVYPLTAGLNLKPLSKAIQAALERTPELPEWCDPAYLARQDWPPWNTALLAAHHPDSEADLEANTKVRERLAYDELLANQMALALLRASLQRASGCETKGDGRLREIVRTGLPFTLTAGQLSAIEEIEADLMQPHRMLRLLQGDVGSGKTVVALFTMLIAVEAGAQAALMAPTELLARQHFATLEKLLAESGVTVALLTGRGKKSEREAVLASLAAGAIDIAVGTHALFQSGVEFSDLAVAVVDEQHRFGVHQRMTLAAKGKGVDVLVMTATPIPRTLMLTAYGDLQSSRLHEKPAGRAAVETRVLPINRLDEVIDGIQRAVEGGARVYWICPLVEESEAVDLAAVAERHAQFENIFAARVGLVHGRMKSDDKDAAMSAFAGGDLDVLVATTVIEVGIDVPDATIIVVEHAERFGLAQLHQLRGRVGRADKAGNCLLLYAPPLGETARARLEILRETDDGFRIAEEDLKLRGAGELLGTRQSGLPELRLADLARHGELLATARDDARLILERDPELKSERSQALRILLYLFERDAAARYLRSA
ncbi:MAG: ATP-dependent DNA helicase RecG [Alphaproteobacteria bacterium MarineAlpha10_Bin2]|nr:MAG: ATP-dependent DNA helicase RecG [Alphaproteobacteria bacterium MarineAlpha10_Bin2]